MMQLCSPLGTRAMGLTAGSTVADWAAGLVAAGWEAGLAAGLASRRRAREASRRARDQPDRLRH